MIGGLVTRETDPEATSVLSLGMSTRTEAPHQGDLETHIREDVSVHVQPDQSQTSKAKSWPWILVLPEPSYAVAVWTTDEELPFYPGKVIPDLVRISHYASALATESPRGVRRAT